MLGMRGLRRGLLVVAVVVAGLALATHVTPDTLLNFFREGSPLDRLTLVLFLVLLVPLLFDRLRLPVSLGLLLAGVALGPHALAISDPESPVVDLFASLGRVFLMFVAGLEVDLRVFQKTRNRSMTFGAGTFIFPLLAGVAVGRLFGFDWNAAFLIGSLLASHTLLGYPVLARMGLTRSEPMAVILGATVFTDVAALLVLAVCIMVHQGGFSWAGLGLQLGQLGLYGVIVLMGFPWLGVRLRRRFRDDETVLFLLVLAAVMLAALGAKLIHLEDIVGAFFAGLAVNRVLGQTEVADKVRFMGESLFIPVFFVMIGLRLDLPVFAATLMTSLPFVAAILVALVGAKFLGAWAIKWPFHYNWPTTLTLWSLSLPQVAATLAAAVAAYETLNADGDRLITEVVLNSVIVLMVMTSVLGPLLTERFGGRLPKPTDQESPHAS